MQNRPTTDDCRRLTTGICQSFQSNFQDQGILVAIRDDDGDWIMATTANDQEKVELSRRLLERA